mmetsp:Transcript_16674/g.36865  ORF Transcript_16674/g.36865 Transcript_16674/m.36865 type:complete len:480 (+) Transcript_16674:137-1576(+)
MTGGGGDDKSAVFTTPHSWLRAGFYIFAIALCIAVDIFQYSMPLPFLPQQLEGRGHSAAHIATTIGGYYWMGFVGGCMITSYQIYRVLYKGVTRPTIVDIKKHLVYLITGLALGAVTLVLEGTHPRLYVHMFCRLTQGFLGAFLFFYAYLLSIELFVGHQQLIALTASTIALNVAEVFGPLLGASIFTAAGSSAAFHFLACLSVVNQVALLVVYFTLPDPGPAPVQEVVPVETPAARFAMGMTRLKHILGSPELYKSIIVVAPAALVKAGVEEILPFFADHELAYTAMSVGMCFTIVAMAFICTSVLSSVMWTRYTWFRTWGVGLALGGLGMCAGGMILSYKVMPTHAHGEAFFFTILGLYGCCLGFTMTPGAYFIGEFIDTLQDSASKDAANGIWNTMWEFGGSLGFVIASFPATSSWLQESMVLGALGMAVMFAAAVFLVETLVTGRWSSKTEEMRLAEVAAVLAVDIKPLGYGATA